jgi:hypothetical protein
MCSDERIGAGLPNRVVGAHRRPLIAERLPLLPLADAEGLEDPKESLKNLAL